MNSRRVKAAAPAKINLGLWVTAKRKDGFHDLLTVFQAVDFFDLLTFDPGAEGELTLSVSNDWVPEDESNLVLRAAKSLWRHIGSHPGASVHLEKNIPPGAGLGGGSSDAAATLLALDELWGLGLSGDQLHALALELGSDVPFFLEGGTALGQGRGDVLTSLKLPPVPWGWILVLPSAALSTREVFENLPGELKPVSMEPSILRDVVQSGDFKRLARVLENQLETAASQASPWIGRLKAGLEQAAPSGSFISMTGSGSAFYILTPTILAGNQFLTGGRFWEQAPWASEFQGKLAMGQSGADTDSVNIRFVTCSPVSLGAHILKT